MNTTHKIYITDINFGDRAATADERDLRKNSEVYSDIFNRRLEIKKSNSWDGNNVNNFAGVIDYLPTCIGGDIKKSSDILLYLYKNKTILHNLYNSCIESITSFINTNKIKSIQFSGDDVYRFTSNGLDIINDVTTRVDHKLNINITKKRSLSNKYKIVYSN